jgi:putative two-component system response regulator
MNETRRAAKILIADDEPGIVTLLRTLCESSGYAIAEAHTGRQVEEAVREDPPDLILMDGVMPQMDGFTATKKLKEDPATVNIPIIMLTGLKSREDRLKGIAAGANDFLTKPIDAEDLVMRVANNLKIKQYHDLLKNYNDELERKVAERTAALRRSFGEVSRANRETIFRLALSSEYKDEATGAHIRRISHFSRELGSEIGLDKSTLETLFFAAPMHDIGKVGIPDALMLKPGPLSPEEWEIMQSHTRLGGKILAGSQSPYLKMGEKIALTHHERWDGSGYPEGLTGEQIPLTGRIVNLADQYDALRAERPYKPALPHDRVLEIILKGDGRTEPGHFDPQVLEAFRKGMKRFEEIHASIMASDNETAWLAEPMANA